MHIGYIIVIYIYMHFLTILISTVSDIGPQLHMSDDRVWVWSKSHCVWGLLTSRLPRCWSLFGVNRLCNVGIDTRLAHGFHWIARPIHRPAMWWGCGGSSWGGVGGRGGGSGGRPSGGRMVLLRWGWLSYDETNVRIIIGERAYLTRHTRNAHVEYYQYYLTW